MIENQPQNVITAFEMLLEEIEAEVDFVNRIGAESFETRNYEQVQEALSRAGQITGFRDRVAALRKEWLKLAKAGEQQESPKVRAERQNLGKLRKGLRTPEEAYWRPVLESIVELGGKGQIGDVLDRVFKKMKAKLNKYDLQPLASDKDNPRWRNAAQWARNSMVNEGLLRNDSPRGEWAITEAGRSWLKQKGVS